MDKGGIFFLLCLYFLLVPIDLHTIECICFYDSGGTGGCSLFISFLGR